MYFKNKLKETFDNQKINLFVDMDGVITDYNFGQKLEFEKKRPLYANIEIFNELSKDSKIKLYILSICKTTDQIKTKNSWLDKYAPFFPLANRYIISKDKHPNKSSREIKLNVLKDLIEEQNLPNVVLVDDDNAILKYLSDNLDITLFQDSSIVE